MLKASAVILRAQQDDRIWATVVFPLPGSPSRRIVCFLSGRMELMFSDWPSLEVRGSGLAWKSEKYVFVVVISQATSAVFQQFTGKQLHLLLFVIVFFFF